MTLKERVVKMQLDALSVTDFNGLFGDKVAKTLREHKELWSMMYFGGDELIICPVAGREDDLAALFQLDYQEKNPVALIQPDECDWEELDDKRFIRAWWD